MSDTPGSTLTLIRDEAERRGLVDGDLVDVTFDHPTKGEMTFRHVVRVVDSLDEPPTLFSGQQGNRPR